MLQFHNKPQKCQRFQSHMQCNLMGLQDKNRLLRLGLKKLQFKFREVQFHGHILSATGLKPDPEKVKAIIDIDIDIDMPSNGC